MSLQWYKFYGVEYLSDPKISALTPQERSCWITLLCLASSSSEPGLIEYLEIDSLLNMSGIRWDPYNTDEYDNAKSVLQKLERMKMIKANENGQITILNWEKRQESFLTGAERAAKYRAKKKSVASRNKPRDKSNSRIDKNRIDKNILNTAETSSADTPLKKEVKILDPDSKEIPLILKEFESLNPAVKRMYGNKTQRQACSDLIKTYSFEKVTQVVKDILPQIKGQPFFPDIGTPYELFNKWSKLESAILRYGKEKKIKSKVAF